MVTRYFPSFKQGMVEAIHVATEEYSYVTHADYKALEEERDSWRRVAEGLELKRGESLREIAHLTAELAECRKDAERLNYLGGKCTGASDSERYLPFRIYWGGGRNKTIREAIDNAIARSK